MGFVILDFEGPNKQYGVIVGLGVCEVYVENNASYNFIKSMGFEEYDIKIYNSDNFH